MLPIVDITKFTLQDFPNRTSCIVWFAGCNFRCHYCHNPEFIFLEKCSKFISESEIFDFLKSRVGLLDGVVLSGGEVCLNDNIYFFIEKIKKMGFLVKIDTNGTNTSLIKKLVGDKLVDFWAIDYKSTKDKFFNVTGSNEYSKFRESLEFLIKNDVKMEVRTTVHTKLLDENDINSILDDLEFLNYDKVYAIQNFRNNKTLSDIGEQEKTIDKSLIKQQQQKIKIEYRNFLK